MRCFLLAVNALQPMAAAIATGAACTMKGREKQLFHVSAAQSRFHTKKALAGTVDTKSFEQEGKEMEILNEVINPQIVYYGPHPCDLCGKENIVQGSVDQGFGDIRLEYPVGEIIYPNRQWKEHKCPCKTCAFCGELPDKCTCPHEV